MANMRSLMGPLESTYPANLRPLRDAPPLHCRGELLSADARSVAVVGTRSPSRKGLAQARRLASRLARADVTVVSGLARGIDTAAHEAGLDAGGRTIAVLGCGIDDVYPAENRALADRIALRGALISQLPARTPPSAQALRARNALIAGIAQATVVIEAGSTSGARIAARWTLALGRPLFLTELVAAEAWAAHLLSRPGVHLLGGDRLEALLAAAADESTRLLQLPLPLAAPG
jgi:DNA processing protein